MRSIGVLPDEATAHRLADYLTTLDISTRVDKAEAGWRVWAHRDEQVEQARAELAAFLANPNDARFHNLATEARAKRKKAEQETKQHERSSIQLGGRLNVRSWARCPATYALIVACVVVSLLTNVGMGAQSSLADWLYFTRFEFVTEPVAAPAGQDEPSLTYFAHVRSTGLDAISRGEVWRLITPIFLHFGPLHLIFNMFCFYDLGGLIEMRKSSKTLLLLVLASGLFSNLIQYEWEYQREGLAAVHPFGGMSGVVYALLGYTWMKRDYEPETGLSLRSSTIVLMIIWLIACMTGHFGPVANAAHVSGLLFGMGVGLAPTLWQSLYERASP